MWNVTLNDKKSLYDLPETRGTTVTVRTFPEIKDIVEENNSDKFTVERFTHMPTVICDSTTVIRCIVCADTGISEKEILNGNETENSCTNVRCGGSAISWARKRFLSNQLK